MRVIVQYIVPTENMLKRDSSVQQASVWTCLFSPPPLGAPRLSLKAHVMQATLINILDKHLLQ